MARSAVGSTAVIVDRWPMIRIGLAKVLLGVNVRVVADTPDGAEGLAMLRATSASLLVLGDHIGRPVDLVQAAKQLPQRPIVAVLLGQVTRDELLSLLGAGVDGLLIRAVGPDEFVVATNRLLAGERVVSPVLLESLVGMLDISPTDGEATEGLPATLTSKEREVLARLADGNTNNEIATALYVSAATVKTHLSHIYAKLGAKTRHEALARAVALGLLK